MAVMSELFPVRKPMCHHPPFGVCADDAWYFITICAAEHGSSSFADHADAILDAARHYHRIGKWFVALFLVMPDHLHAIIHVPPVGGDVLGTPHSPVGGDVLGTPHSPVGGDVLGTPHSCSNEKCVVESNAGRRDVGPYHAYRGLAKSIGDFKTFLTRTTGLAFQRDFFDTRIRDDAHYAEKWRYIVRNPVTRGLVATPREWPHVIAFNRDTGEERHHGRAAR